MAKMIKVVNVVKVVKGLISAEDNLLLLLFDCLICLISPNQFPICQHYLLSQANLGSCDTICFNFFLLLSSVTRSLITI